VDRREPSRAGPSPVVLGRTIASPKTERKSAGVRAESASWTSSLVWRTQRGDLCVLESSRFMRGRGVGWGCPRATLEAPRAPWPCPVTPSNAALVQGGALYIHSVYIFITVERS
jgi:hypothetical protein